MAERTADRIGIATYICGIHSARSIPVAFASRVSSLAVCYRFMADLCVRSAPWEPIILLDCALSLWAILRFRPEVLQLSASSPGSTIMRCKLQRTYLPAL